MTIWYSNGAVNGNSNHNWNASNTWNQATDGGGTAGNPTDGDIAIIQSGDIVTLTADVTSIAAFKVIGTLAGGSGYKITVRGAYSNKPIDNDGTITGIVNVRIENQGTGSTPADGWIVDLLGATSGDKFTNLEIDLTSGTTSHNTVEWIGDFNLLGNITIENGTFQGYNGGYTGRCDGDLEIQNGGVFGNSSQTAVYILGSLTINSGGEFYAASTTTTINSHLSNKAISNAGTFENNEGTVIIDITNSNKTMVDARATYYSLTINSDGSNKEVELNNLAATIEGNLTVEEGKLYTYATSGRDLTVDGDVSIEDGGEIDMNNAAGKDASFGSLTIASGGTYSATSGTTTITNESSGAISGFAWYNLGTFDDNDGTVTIGDGSTAIGDTHIRENRFHHLIINRDASSTNTIWRDVSGNTLTIDGDFTITKGTFFRNTVADTLTVTGDVSVGATGKLGDASESGANNFGSLTIASGGEYIATQGITSILSNASNYAINNGGTFTHNDGTVTIGPDGSNQWLKGSGTGAYYNLISDNNSTLGMGVGADLVVDNDLTINASKKLGFVGALYDITVTGSVLVSGNFTTSTTPTGDHTFGDLTIASGGEYIATSGITTLTSRTGGAGTYALENNGTFTHNNGTVAITDADNNVSMKLGANLYNLELSGGYKKIRDNTTINNNLTLTSGDLYGHSGSLTLDVLGQTILNGGTTGQTIAFTGTMNWGNVTVNSGTLKLSSGTNNAESFRNVGGTIQ